MHALWLCLAVSDATSALEAGAAKVDLALEPGIPLDGDFTRRGRAATSVDDPLYARALYLEGDGVACFLVSLDAFAVSPELRARVLEMAPGIVPAENIILTATHTRSGPGGLDRGWLARQRGGRFIPELVDRIAGKVAEAMQLAYDTRKRCAVGYASGTIALAVDAFSPQEPVQSNVTVLRVDDSDGNPIAIAGSFGAAPAAVSRFKPFALSADFPGAYCDALEGMTAAGTVAFFLNGESADRGMAAPGQPADRAAVRAFGESIASRVKALTNDITCRELSLRFTSTAVDVPQHVAMSLLPADAIIQVLEIQQLAIAFMPVVPYAAVAAQMRHEATSAGYSHVMTVAPANGYLGAIAPLEQYAAVNDSGDPVYFDPSVEGRWVSEVAAALPRADGRRPDETEPSVDTAVTQRGGLIWLNESGSGTEMGAARGSTLRSITGAETVIDGEFNWLGTTRSAQLLSHWTLLRGAVNDDALVLALASGEARRLLAPLPAGFVERLASASDSAGIPFQRLWMMQLAPAETIEGVARSGAGVLFTARMPDDAIGAGFTLEYPASVAIAVVQSDPRDGHGYVTAGYAWQPAGLCGINDRGLAVAAAPWARPAHAPLRAPVETLFSEVLARAATIDDAVAILTVPRDGVSGRTLILADDGERSHAVLVETGPMPVVLDMVPVDVVLRDATAPSAQEARVARLLRGLGEADVGDVERIATDRDRRAAETDHVMWSRTRACVVLLPRSRELRVMAPEAAPPAGRPLEFERVSAGGEGS